MKDTNYLTIQGWMINQLKLKGAELMTFATIYGFSQDGDSVFSGTLGYLSEWVGVSKQSMCAVLKKLVEKNLIIKLERNVNGVQFFDYKVNLITIQEILSAIKETLMETPKPIKETLMQDIYNNNNNNIYIQEKPKNKKFNPPTMEECIEYAKEISCKKELGIQFFNYYNLSNWIDGKNKQVKCWKQKMYQWYMHNQEKYYNDIPDKPNCPSIEEVEKFRKEHALKI